MLTACLPKWPATPPTLPTCRAAHRLVYRATIDFVALVPVCLGLQQKKAVSLYVVRGRVDETVQVVAATAPCSTMVKKSAGAAAPQTFQILVKKSGVPLANSFVVVSFTSACACRSPWLSDVVPVEQGGGCLQRAQAACTSRSRHPLRALQVRCEKGKSSCYTYRLSRPCRTGRCNTDPDRTLEMLVMADPEGNRVPSLLDLE